MFFTLDKLKKEIRIALDQNNSSALLEGVGDIDTLTVEEIITSKIVDAVRMVTIDAPSYLLDGGKPFAGSLAWESQPGYGCGWTLLPDDFMRLVCFKMSDWSYAVTDAVLEDSQAYRMQRSRFPGIRGNPERPVVAITSQPAGLVLEFYSCSAGSEAYVTRARYIPFPKIVADEADVEGIEICEKLKPAVVYYAAYLTALSTGAADQATALLQTSRELIK